ncbi:galactose-3-O-sulfotransferase 2-like [Mytilus californianus]|uniref:galactose-3-O-sulfotransferase 2-like n=1 Tax=Mytilus californianus TaxID=6549 RepID=UPI002247DF9C|nr:galactose-3-O-sulfotransferase 2-like [Mytilus californianus]
MEQKMVEYSEAVKKQLRSHKKDIHVTNLNSDTKSKRIAKLNESINTTKIKKHISNLQRPDIKYDMYSRQTATKKVCSFPMTHVAFLKTHKTASSTIMSIIQRFGYFRNLTFIMPLKKIDQYRFNYIGKPGETISYDNIIPKREEDEYDLLCNHVIYNEDAFQNTFPNDTFLFTIIREPLKQLISTVNYYGYTQQGYFANIFNQSLTNPMSDYLKSPWKFEPSNPHYSVTNNKMSVDLGLPIGQIRNGSFIKSYLERLNKRFKLVLLQEYFDESLILFKRYTCWSFKDMIYISKNIWPLHQNLNLSAEDIDNHRKWNVADYALYETFYKIFWTKVLKEKEFFDEVYHFRRILQKVNIHCSNDKQSKNLTIFDSKWSPGFILTPEDCIFLKLNETKFITVIHKRMMSRAYPKGSNPFEQTASEHELAHLF